MRHQCSNQSFEDALGEVGVAVVASFKDIGLFDYVKKGENREETGQVDLSTN